VIVNLVTNAAHALPDGRGIIELKLDAYEDQSGAIAGAQPNAGRYARLVIRDNGTGMSPQTVARIFDPFFTTKPTGRGTGLGLSVVHGIIEAHAGRISVESREGEGTTVEVGLPATTAAMAPLRGEDAQVPPGASECVLYVDDDPAIVSLTTRVLERLAYRVDGYHNPKEALEAFRAHPERYSVVITDLSMPVMSGFELAAEVRAVRPDTPILLTSGYVRPSDREAARAHGIEEIILKPGTVSELGVALDRVLRDCKRRRGPSS
jgi:CheY-like chemotaxis protein